MLETKKIWMNGELVDWADATVHIGTHGLHYGSGVFEGIRAYETERGTSVFRLTDHLERLHRSAQLLYLDLPFSVEELRAVAVGWSAKKQGHATVVTNGERTPGKVAIFSTCYVNYNEPGIGHDLLKVLEHNDIPYVIVDKESCCGMPKLELGDLGAVAKAKEANIPRLAKYAHDGYAIVSAIPSCTLMFKQELPLMFPGDADVKRVQEAMFDPFEYLVARHKDGLLKTDFNTALGKVSYHIPCHGRVQNIGRKTEEMFKLIGQSVEVKLNTVERCSGHAGTYGVKTATHPVAMKIGKPVFKAMAKDEPDVISSDCALAGHHIAQGMSQAGTPAKALQHPLSLMRRAYGLE